MNVSISRRVRADSDSDFRGRWGASSDISAKKKSAVDRADVEKSGPKCKISKLVCGRTAGPGRLKIGENVATRGLYFGFESPVREKIGVFLANFRKKFQLFGGQLESSKSDDP